MDETEETIDESDHKHETRDRLAKLLIGTAVGFIATKVVENVYDALVERRRSTPAEDQQ